MFFGIYLVGFNAFYVYILTSNRPRRKAIEHSKSSWWIYWEKLILCFWNYKENENKVGAPFVENELSSTSHFYQLIYFPNKILYSNIPLFNNSKEQHLAVLYVIQHMEKLTRIVLLVVKIIKYITKKMKIIRYLLNDEVQAFNFT